MRAIVLLCLLRTSFGGDTRYTWDGPVHTTQQADSDISGVCLSDQASCGCCLIQKQMMRLEQFFDLAAKEMNKDLIYSKTALNDIRARRSAFSVALTNDKIFNCYGPFTNDKLILYKNVLINLGNSYNVQTGIFIVPLSGVYSLTVTIYPTVTSHRKLAACTNLKVNDQVVATLLEQIGQDVEDSASVIVALHLNAGDQVAVDLIMGCYICDTNSGYNTFTGFLLYATD